MCKKILSLVLCLILVVGTGVPGSAADGTTGNTVTVTFDPNGGTVTANGNPVTSKVDISLTADGNTDYTTTFNDLNPQRTGYTHTGWSNSNGSLVLASTKVDLSHNQTTLTAQWKAMEFLVKYNLNYSVDDTGPVHPGDQAPTKADGKATYDSNFGAAVAAPESSMIPVGYDFAGWYTDATNGDEVTSNTNVAPANPTANTEIELFAHWTPVILNVTCDFNYPEGAVVTASPAPAAPKFKVTYNGTYDRLDGQPVAGAIPLGFKFGKWMTAKDGTGDERTKDSPVKITADETLYAQWERTHYVVSLDYGVVARPEDEKEHLLYATPKPAAPIANAPAAAHPNYSDGKDQGCDGPLPSPTATGYTFLGWAKEAKQNTDGAFVVDEKTPVVGANDEVKGDHTLYAK